VYDQILKVAGAFLLLMLSGCYVTQGARVPMPAEHHSAKTSAEGLIVFLPGFWDSPKKIEANGMIDIVRQIAPGFDVVVPNAHFAYYRKQNIVERLHTDVIQPIAHRYQQLWLVGVSMGGLGASSYAMKYPEDVDGVILLAPYMGDEELIDEIASAGGLKHWSAPDLLAIESNQQRHFYELWTWYQAIAEDPSKAPRLMLGFGEDDRLRRANRLLAAELPPEHVLSIPGGHKWKVWVPLFGSLLRRAVNDK
jgi:pimeloyl-ACP methyl ester carboxylesterase